MVAERVGIRGYLDLTHDPYSVVCERVVDSSGNSLIFIEIAHG